MSGKCQGFLTVMSWTGKSHSDIEDSGRCNENVREKQGQEDVRRGHLHLLFFPSLCDIIQSQCVHKIHLGDLFLFFIPLKLGRAAPL